MITDFNRLQDIFYFSFFQIISFCGFDDIYITHFIHLNVDIFFNTIGVLHFSSFYYYIIIISILFQIELKNGQMITTKISLPENIQRFLLDGTRHVKTFSKYFDRTPKRIACAMCLITMKCQSILVYKSDTIKCSDMLRRNASHFTSNVNREHGTWAITYIKEKRRET